MKDFNPPRCAEAWSSCDGDSPPSTLTDESIILSSGLNVAGSFHGRDGTAGDRVVGALPLRKGLDEDDAMKLDKIPRVTENESFGCSSRDVRAEKDVSTPTVLTKLKKWADYESVGNPVWPTRFLPMKTPMSNEIIHNWSLENPPKHTLTVETLVEGQERVYGRRVGLIIDLANHECLYKDDMLPLQDKYGLEYAHIQLVAKELPPRSAIDKVERVAKEFWARKPEEHAAIHCAYGFNRTGFVVCSYLCQAHGLSVEESLKAFAAARPPGVKHAKFVDELHARYDANTGVGNEASEQVSAFQEIEDEQPGYVWEGEDGSQPRSMEPPVTPDTQLASTQDGSVGDHGGSPSSDGNNTSALKSPRSRPIGILTRSAPTSMRRPQDHDDGVSCSDEEYGRSYSSTGALEKEDLGCMADSLNFNVSMRRETSIGLAKALHIDFGQHDFHVDELDKMGKLLSMQDEGQHQDGIVSDDSKNKIDPQTDHDTNDNAGNGAQAARQDTNTPYCVIT